MILTPEEIAQEVAHWKRIDQTWGEGNISQWGQEQGICTGLDVVDTLRAYADIVQRVAGGAEFGMPTHFGECCYYCGADPNGPKESRNHSRNCLYLTARKLRGLE